MSTPYFAFVRVVPTREDIGVASYEDLKGRPVGGIADAFKALALEKDSRVQDDTKGSSRAYQFGTDIILAVSQGYIDAMVVSSTVATLWIKSGKYKGLKIAGDAPYDIDYVALDAKRNEYSLFNYLNLLINQQMRTGHYTELTQKWVGDTTPELTTSMVYR